MPTRIRKFLKDRLAQKLVDRLVESGQDREKAEDAVELMVKDRPIIQWLVSLDWEAIIKRALDLIKILA